MENLNLGSVVDSYVIIEKIEDSIATVNFSGNIVRAHTGVVNVAVGDYVLVHAGLVIQKLDKEVADNMTELFEAIKEIENGYDKKMDIIICTVSMRNKCKCPVRYRPVFLQGKTIPHRWKICKCN